MNVFQKIAAKAKERSLKRRAKRAELGLDRPIDQTRAMTKKKLDELWSFFIRLRDRMLHGPKCRICGVREGEVAYHIVPKQRGDAIRWDLENGVLACSGCNLGEMMNRSLYRDKHVALFGGELVERIEARARTLVKFSRVDLWSIAEGIRLEISRVRIGGAKKCP